ncbi:MAG: hypothetical protein AB1505_10870 [Candidatus Latescibacterota bacterium]
MAVKRAQAHRVDAAGRAALLLHAMNRILAVVLVVTGWGCAPLQPPQEKPPDGQSSPGGAGLPAEAALTRFLHRKHLVADTSAAARPWVAVLPFTDDSGFRGDIWDVGREMARLICAEMIAYPEWQVVPPEVVEEVFAAVGRSSGPQQVLEGARHMEADLVLQGTVTGFNMGRFTVGDPLLGGYKSYSGIAQLRAQAIATADGAPLGEVAAEREVVDRDLGLDLLGKPREQDVQFASLRGLRFGSEEFRQTVLGKATLEAVGELLQGLAALVSPRELKLSGQPPEVVSVYQEEVYINLGSENLVRAGYRFEVLPGPLRVRQGGEDPHRVVGVVEVREVIGARLSSVRVLQGAGSIRQGDRVQLAAPSPAAQ